MKERTSCYVPSAYVLGRLLGRESLLFRHLAQTCRRTSCRRSAQQAKLKKIDQKLAFPSNFDLNLTLISTSRHFNWAIEC